MANGCDHLLAPQAIEGLLIQVATQLLQLSLRPLVKVDRVLQAEADERVFEAIAQPQVRRDEQPHATGIARPIQYQIAQQLTAWNAVKADGGPFGYSDRRCAGELYHVQVLVGGLALGGAQRIDVGLGGRELVVAGTMEQGQQAVVGVAR